MPVRLPELNSRSKNLLGMVTVASAFLPVILWYFARLDDGGGEPFGLIPLALAIIFSLRNPQPASPKAALISLIIYTLCFPFCPPLIRAIPALFTIAFLTGIHRSAGLTGLLLLSLPLQASLDFFLGYPFRIVTAEGARTILDLMGYQVSRLGVQLTIKDTIVSVDPPCSGLQMLWMSAFMTATLASLFSLNYPRSILLGIAALCLCLLGNTLRAGALFFPESGLITLPSFMHPAMGLIIFTILTIPLLRLARRLQLKKTSPLIKPHGIPLSLITVAFLSNIFIALAPPFKLSALSERVSPLTHYHGEPVEELELSPFEKSFAETFPGQFNIYRVGEKTLIVRHVTLATRRLHPSSDCLLGAGFTLTPATAYTDSSGQEWLRYQASRHQEKFIVTERIHSLSEDQQWTEVSAWYWHALFHPGSGPWQAETLITPF